MPPFNSKEKCGTFTKSEIVKETLSANKFFKENLRSGNFVLNLRYYHNCNITVEMKDIFQNTCFKERSNMPDTPSLWITINLSRKFCFQLSHGIKNIHRSKLYE